MSRGRVAALVLLVCALMLHATRTGAQFDSLLEAAVKEYAAERYAEARALFVRAHVEQPSARTLRALGFCDYELKQYARAVEELEGALNDLRLPLTAPQRAEVDQLLVKARRFVGTLVVTTTPPDAQLRVDGEVRRGPELTLDAGEHELEASLATHQTRTARVSVTATGTSYVALSLPPLELKPGPALAPIDDRATSSLPDRTKFGGAPGSTDDGSILTRWWFWTAAGVVVAGATVAAVVATHQPEQVNGGTTGVVLRTR